MIKPRARIGDKYRLDSSWYLRADKKIGRPGIIGGEDLITGDRVLVKQWRRDAVNAEELREMWAHEIRQLHSLSGSANASEVFIPMIESGEDEHSFYLILSLGRRSPLQDVINKAPTSSWLRLIRQRQSRVLLWLNLKRLATALNILHSRGILHRHLDSWAVFTDGGDEEDFRLGGFEWSLRLVDVEAKNKRRKMFHPDREYYSFVDDWHDLGILVANLLDIKLAANKKDFKTDITFLEPAERQLLRTLIYASKHHDIDQEGLFNLIEEAIDASEVADSHSPNQLILACNLSPQSFLAKAIARVSNGTIVAGNQDKLRQFIEADLADTPLLIERKSAGRKNQYVLQGSNLTFELKKYSPANSSESTWDIAYCERESRYRTNPQQIVNRRPVKSSLLRILTLVQVKSGFKLLRNATRRWDRFLHAIHDADTPITRQDKYYAAFVLLLLLESELHSASILPVTIKEQVSLGSDLTEIYIIPRRDEQRDALAHSLGLDEIAKRMRKLFEDGDVDFDSDWILSETDVSHDELAEKTLWKFVDVVKEGDSQPLYRFQSDAMVPIAKDLFIYPSSLKGTDRLMIRHGRALSALREHEELLGVIEEPRQFQRRTSDEVVENATFKSLDIVKQEVLKNAFNTLPIYLVQGPPGVGKTRLVAALADQQFTAHSNSRLLLTAQSHQTVDHLLEKVADEVRESESESKLLIVRCKPRDVVSDQLKDYDLWVQTKKIINDFSVSSLVRTLPGTIKESINKACETFDDTDNDSSSKYSSTAGVRAIESLVLRSANLVFSTTNAVDLERLIEERAHFDLSLIEEAAKATGVELITPFILSHKRIAIGDHKQLPPFESERREVLLRETSVLQNALSGGWPMVAASFRAVGLDDIVDRILGLSDDEFSEIGSISTEMLTLFQSMVEREFERQHQSLDLIAQKLNIQHRMHPIIASLVASTFYDNDLITHEDAVKRFNSEKAPIISADDECLPSSPVVFVDVPYIQSDVGVMQAEANPPYHNPREVELILKILKLLKPQINCKSIPSLAVLSPYKEQKHRISEAIDNSPETIDHLKIFQNTHGTGIHVGTVDSFQGNEADVVIISLVRNNHRNGAKALGFLRDARRMNVLLSRAKWKLIIIGSFEFLHNCVASVRSESDAPLFFLKKFLDKFCELEMQQLDNGAQAAVRIKANILESEE